jgi:hypothetical protein
VPGQAEDFDGIPDAQVVASGLDLDDGLLVVGIVATVRGRQRRGGRGGIGLVRRGRFFLGLPLLFFFFLPTSNINKVFFSCSGFKIGL